MELKLLDQKEVSLFLKESMFRVSWKILVWKVANHQNLPLKAITNYKVELKSHWQGEISEAGQKTHLSLSYRPDKVYSVSLLSQFMHDPQDPHMQERCLSHLAVSKVCFRERSIFFETGSPPNISANKCRWGWISKMTEDLHLVTVHLYDERWSLGEIRTNV